MSLEPGAEKKLNGSMVIASSNINDSLINLRNLNQRNDALYNNGD